jgi:hypothetical protein
MKIGSNISSLYFADDWVDSWYDHTNRVIVTTWFDLSTNEHYRAVYLAKLAAAKKFQPKALIIDTSKAFGRAHPENHKWLVAHVLPEVKKLGIPFIINIFPDNLITRTGVKSIIDTGKDLAFDIIMLHSLEHAYEYIRSQSDPIPRTGDNHKQ